MSQSRIGSLAEAGVNILIGYLVNLVGQVLIFPLFGIHIGISANLGIGLAFTILSLLRSYVLRRYFNNLKWGNK